MNTETTQPDLVILMKLASVFVHVEEFLEPCGHEFDQIALQQLINDSDLRMWIEGMQDLGLAPVRRS